MKYIPLLIGSILMLASCSEVKMSGGDDRGGVVTARFRDTVVTVFENAGTGTLNIDFSQALQRDTRIRVEVTEEMNMKEEQDYFLPLREIDVPAGQTTAEVHYSLVDDNVANTARSFTLRLMAVNGGLVDSLAATTRVEVLDDETDAALGFGTTAVVCPERVSGSATASYRYEIPVKLFGTYHKPAQFRIAVHPLTGGNTAVEGTHFRLLQSAFILENGATEVMVPVEIFDDKQVNIDRVFALDITEVAGASVYTAQRRCVVTIENDDLGVYFGRTALTVEERAGVVKVPVRINKASDADLSFTLACAGSAVDGSDYTVQKTWTIPAGKDSVLVEVNVNHLGGIAPDRVLELGFESVSAGLEVFDQGPTCALTIQDCDTPVDFDQAALKIQNSTTTLSLPVTLDGALEHDAVLNITVTPRLNMIDADAVPVAAQVTIPAGQTTATVNVNLRKLVLRKRALFDVQIAGVAGATVGEAATCAVEQYFVFQTSDFRVASFTTEEPTGEGAGNGVAAAAIDGNEDTFWHSNWNGGGSSLPQSMAIELLPENLQISTIEVVRRVKGTSDTKTAELYLSQTVSQVDAAGWGAAIGTMHWENSGDQNRAAQTQALNFDAPITGKYLKINVTEGYRNYAQIAEIVIYGYTE